MATLEELYQQILGRAPDAAGLDYWSQQFGSDVDPDELAIFLRAALPELTAPAPAPPAPTAPLPTNLSQIGYGALGEIATGPGFDPEIGSLPVDMSPYNEFQGAYPGYRQLGITPQEWAGGVGGHNGLYDVNNATWDDRYGWVTPESNVVNIATGDTGSLNSLLGLAALATAGATMGGAFGGAASSGAASAGQTSLADMLAADASQLAGQGLSAGQMSTILQQGYSSMGVDAFMAADIAQLAEQGLSATQIAQNATMAYPETFGPTYPGFNTEWGSPGVPDGTPYVPPGGTTPPPGGTTPPPVNKPPIGDPGIIPPITDYGNKVVGLLGGALLGGLDGSKESGKITTTTEPWSEQKPYLTDLFARSKSAMDNIGGPSLGENSAVNSLHETATGINGNPMLGMDNPYLSKTIQTAQDDVTRNMQGQFNTASRQSGSYGNSGLDSEFAREMPRALGNIDTAMRMQDYTNQQGLYENAANRKLSASRDLYTAAKDQRNTPFNNLEKYGSLIRGNYGGSSSQPYFTNPTADILGGAMAGYNLFTGGK